MKENSAEAYKPDRKRTPLRLAGRYMRPVLAALLFAQTMALPISTLADDKNTGGQVSDEYLVDVIIHRSLPPHQTEDWARDAIDHYLNRRFGEAGTNKRFRTGQIIPAYDETTECATIPEAIPVYDRCEFNDGKIRVWLYPAGFRYGSILIGTSASLRSAVVQKELPYAVSVEEDGFFGQRVHGDELVHEVGHLFGIPDFYEEDVEANLNQVVPVGIIAFARDVMHNRGNNHFSDISRNYIARVKQLPIDGEPDLSIRFTPKQTIFEITDDGGKPLNEVKVELFPQRTTVNDGRQIERIIPDIPSRTGYTNEMGQFDLGDYYTLFHSSGEQRQADRGFAAFLRITRGAEIRYAAFTRSYLNHLYFQGYEDTALVSVPFSALLKFEEGKLLYLSAPGMAIEF